ncbi:hypothetical protein ANN_16997 [Periplaneta americana]|uniref:Uncharacterized protein n=1 Tax=Periplaneta americana TaxID=6978 RepID=A0ABQ8ST13_PERAM|nr:hypothetical protein ANN_16997 [Periplaneta americana]
MKECLFVEELGTIYNVGLFGNSSVRLLLPSTWFLGFFLNQSASDGEWNPRKLKPRNQDIRVVGHSLRTIRSSLAAACPDSAESKTLDEASRTTGLLDRLNGITD